MRSKTIASLFIFFLIQPGKFTAQVSERFFPEKNLMQIGVYYYPEQWPREQWRRDIKRIADLGFEFIHMGEFAWANMEPKPGVFDFKWLDECIEEAYKNKLKVILCTPTPAPPAWLTRQHPEVLLVNQNGIQQEHGSRLHINYTHAVYQVYAKRIIGEMASHYGKDKRIWGWQLDNEPHFGTLYDYSPTAHSGFQNWVMTKYKSVDALNTAWGAAFWSQRYNSFDQVGIPNTSSAPQGTNPHALLDFQRYTADALAMALKYQADTLRKAITKTQFITTNFAFYRFLPPVDPFRSKKDLDFPSHTMYLLSTYLEEAKGDMGFRLGNGLELSIGAEITKSVSGFTGIMELQPGQINWGKWNSQPLPGAVRMWVWHAFALGEKFACTYRYRQPLYGSEMYHNGIMETDGVTLSRGGAEFIQALQETRELRKYYVPAPELPRDLVSRNTALLWTTDNLLDLEIQKQTDRWDSWKYLLCWYSALKNMGAPVSFVQEEEDVDPEKFPFLIVPAYQMVDPALVNKWKAYAESGGNLILTCRSGQKNKAGHFPETLIQESIHELIGARVLFFDHMPPLRNAGIATDTGRYSWNIWADILDPDAETQVLARYTDQFYADKAAVVSRKLGKGSVSYFGAWSNGGMLEKNLLRHLYLNKGAKILNLPDNVFVEYRDGFWIMTNYSSSVVDIPSAKKQQILLGNPQVSPGGVCVWLDR